MTKVVKFALVTLVASLLSLRAYAAETNTCKLTQLASLEILVGSDAQLMIQAEIQNRPVLLIVDTGGVGSIIDAAYAKRLNFKIFKSTQQYVDVAGKTFADYVNIPFIQIGNMPVHNVPFLIGNSARSDEYYEAAERKGLPPIVGTFGMNFLSHFDLEINIAGNTLKMISPNHCRNIGAYWSDKYVDIPLNLSRGGLPMISVSLDGKPFNTLIDTGAPGTLMDIKSARKLFGLLPADLKRSDDITGITGHIMTAYERQFRALSVGGVSFQNPLVIISDMGRLDRDDPHLILGMRHLRLLRLYFSFQEKMLYVTSAHEIAPEFETTRQSVPETGISLKPPSGFVLSGDFAGFQNEGAGAAIELLSREKGGSLEKTQAAAIAAFKTTDSKLYSSEKLQGLPYPAYLVHGELKGSDGNQFERWLLIFQDSGFIQTISFTVFKRDLEIIPENIIRTTLSGVQFNAAELKKPSLSPSRAMYEASLQNLPFTYACNCIFKPVGANKLGVRLADANEPGPEISSVLVAKLSGIPTSAETVEAIANYAFRSSLAVESWKEISRRQVVVNHMNATEFVVQGFSTETQNTRRFILTVIQDTGRAYIIAGSIPPSLYDRRVLDYYKVVNAFRLK